MVFNATAHATAQAAGRAPFPFEWKGVVHHVPDASALPTGILRRLVTADTSEALEVLDSLGGVWPEAAAAALMEMPAPTASAVIEAWLAHGNSEEPGKSLSPSPAAATFGQQ